MFSSSLSARVIAVAASAGVVVVGVPQAVAFGTAGATTANRRPICNDLGFNLPPTVGGRVTIPVTDVAADPDLRPIRLVSVFGGAPVGSAVISDNGTPTITNDDVLRFRRTNAAPGTVYLYWTVSDGSLSAQCVSTATDVPPEDNG